jgi:hypothetical protein
MVHTRPFWKTLPAITTAGFIAACAPPQPPDLEDGSTPEMNEEPEWTVLFDGTGLAAWRGYRMDQPPASWQVRDGVLAFEAGEERGDLMTREQFEDFELELEWRISEGGNSGIMFHVVEDYGYAWESGPEMQVLDDARHVDGGNPLTSSGANYALHAPSTDATRPAGEWNRVRLVVQGPRVEHWLNGTKIVEYDLWSDEWRTLVDGSKFAEMPGYGMAESGHIVLQDHDDPVWFRHIRIRRLD